LLRGCFLLPTEDMYHVHSVVIPARQSETRGMCHFVPWQRTGNIHIATESNVKRKESFITIRFPARCDIRSTINYIEWFDKIQGILTIYKNLQKKIWITVRKKKHFFLQIFPKTIFIDFLVFYRDYYWFLQMWKKLFGIPIFLRKKLVGKNIFLVTSFQNILNSYCTLLPTLLLIFANMK